MAERRMFSIDLEFEVIGERGVEQVVATCPQLNVQTSGDSIQSAARRMGEAVVFFFDTAESRHELNEIVLALSEKAYPSPPRGLL